jgi:C_GCAxxG_C_C family probable redox protein
MDKKTIAKQYSERGYNCAQSVLNAYRVELDLDEDLALRLTTGFGSGMGRLCEVCGALTGAFMVIGLKHGKGTADDARDPAKTEHTYALVAELAQKFKERNGSIRCGELLDLDLSKPEDRAYGASEGIFKTRCRKYILDSVELLEEMM